MKTISAKVELTDDEYDTFCRYVRTFTMGSLEDVIAVVLKQGIKTRIHQQLVIEARGAVKGEL